MSPADKGPRLGRGLAALMGETRGEPPLLLLDDVLSELDRDRRARLVESAREHGQVLLTATGADGVDDLADACLFLMRSYSEAGHVNVGTGEDVTIAELAAMVRDIFRQLAATQPRG